MGRMRDRPERAGRASHQVGGVPKDKTLRLRPKEDGDYLRTKERSYRGAFIVKRTGTSKLTLINELGIDDYQDAVRFV